MRIYSIYLITFLSYLQDEPLNRAFLFVLDNFSHLRIFFIVELKIKQKLHFI